jgi:hypothetical protein
MMVCGVTLATNLREVLKKYGKDVDLSCSILMPVSGPSFAEEGQYPSQDDDRCRHPSGHPSVATAATR